LLLGYGGTQSIEAPGNYSKVSIGLLKELGIEPRRFFKYYDQKLFDSMHLEEAVFFDQETFGADRLVPQKGLHYFGLAFTLENVSEMPIAEAARKDLLGLQHARVDYLPELTPEQKRRKLTKTSYKDFLLQSAKVHPDVVKVLQTSTHDLYAVGIDAVSANDCAVNGFPGFKGMTLSKSHEQNPSWMSLTFSIFRTATLPLPGCWCDRSCPLLFPVTPWKTSSRLAPTMLASTTPLPRFAFASTAPR